MDVAARGRGLYGASPESWQPSMHGGSISTDNLTENISWLLARHTDRKIFEHETQGLHFKYTTLVHSVQEIDGVWWVLRCYLLRSDIFALLARLLDDN
jgi:hypothetical protein